MIDIFKNYELQREELLARIAQELQLDKTRLQRMETSYKAVFDVLKKNDIFFRDRDIAIYPQGSVRIGTTVKPINKDDFDLDIVLHIYDIYNIYSPNEVFYSLVKSLENDAYYKTIMEIKSRCVRLNYKNDFHMDILPGCMPIFNEKERIKIPEKTLMDWSSGNPKGYAKWFLKQAYLGETSILREYSNTLAKANIESEPLPNELYLKTPLQRAVQLIKRYRDIYYQNKDYGVSSIVLTTLVALMYQGETSIFDTVDNVTSRINNNYLATFLKKEKFKVLNPVNPIEDFTENWTVNHYESFYNFISDFHKSWQKLKESFETSKDDYIKLFGEGVYKRSLNEQFKTYYKSTSDAYAKANGLIVGGKAMTNSSGNINVNQGIKNEFHRNFGGKY